MDDNAPESDRNGPSAGSLSKPKSRLKLWLFRLIAAVLIPVLFFGAVEIGLRIAGTGYPAGFLEASEEKPDYLVDNYRFAWRFFPRALARSSQPLLVAREKPAGRIRVIVFGGSAAMGYPEPAYGLPRVLQALLEDRYPDREFEVINAGVTAVNSHVVLPIVRDCRALEADAWVVYMGNNEVHGPFGAGTVFGTHDTPLWLIRTRLALARTKTGQLLAGFGDESDTAIPKSWGGLTMFVDHQVRHDDPSLARVYEQFAANLHDVLDAGIARDTPVVVSTVVSNLKDCGPLASLNRPSISKEQLALWQRHYDLGLAAQVDDRPEEAIIAFHEAERIDPDFAELQYRLSTCLLAAGQAEEALAKFHQARDLDALRFRADTKINETILAAAAQRKSQGVHLVDAAAQFALHSPDGIVGDEYLYEHVHFNFAGNFLLATLVADQLAAALDLPDVAGHGWPSEDQCARRLGLTAFHRQLMLREMQSLLRSPPFDGQANRAIRDSKIDAELARLAGEMTPQAARDAVAQFQQLLEQHPDDWTLRVQFAALLESTGDVVQAAEQFRRITAQLPHYAEGFYRLGAVLNRAKEWKEAERALGEAVRLRPDFARAQNSLGICLSHLDRFEASYTHFQRAVQLKPDYAEAYVNWGLVLANQGDEPGAIRMYLSAVEADNDHLPAHMKLGPHFFANKQYDEALVHYQAVARLRPDEPAAHVNLGLLHLRMDRAALAVAELEQAVKLDPLNRTAQRYLEHAKSLAGDGAP